MTEDSQPRYTTARLRLEVDKAKAYARREALEEAAALAEVGDWYGQHQTVGDERRAKAIADRIRALKEETP